MLNIGSRSLVIYRLPRLGRLTWQGRHALNGEDSPVQGIGIPACRGEIALVGTGKILALPRDDHRASLHSHFAFGFAARRSTALGAVEVVDVVAGPAERDGQLRV